MLSVVCMTSACAPSSDPAGADQAIAASRSATRAPRVARDPAFVGAEGNDPWGGPLRRPDRVAIVRLLRASAFEELDRWLGHWQQQFEADPRKETWVLTAFEAFAVADPAFGPVLDAWIAAAPESFAAHAARGSWSTAMGFGARGTETIDETPLPQILEMEAHHLRATADLERAIALRPRTIAAHVDLLAIAKTKGDSTGGRALLDAALRQCPTCYEPRAMYLTSLLPRWGGAYPAMHAFVASQEVAMATAPKLALLRGFAAWDRCRLAAKDDPSAAKRYCDEALQHGEDVRFLVTRSRISRTLKRDDEARADLERALVLSPQHIDALVARHYLRRAKGDILDAGDDLAAAFTLDSHDPKIVEAREWLVAKLRYEGDRLSKTGGHDAAARYFDIAVALVPDDADMRKRQTWNAGLIGPEELARRVAAAPDDYELRLLLDHALAKTRRFAEVVASWDEYLRLNPDDARAHRERGGAKWHLGQRDDALGDTQRACDLGEPKACADLPKMRARAAR